jgi:hypothetical protein
MLTRRTFALQALGWMAGGAIARGAQEWTPNYDEQKVPRYTLPPLLQFQNGRRIRTTGDWDMRREELLATFSRHMYGRTPGRPAVRQIGIVPVDGPQGTAGRRVPRVPASRVIIRELGIPALDGRARRTQIALEWPQHPTVKPLEVLVYQPLSVTTPVPTFVGLNFYGNHAIHKDPAIRLSERWMRASDANGVRDHRATERSRGTTSSRWPVEAIVDAGCAVMTAYYGDLAPDDPAEVGNGIAPLFADEMAAVPADERWGAIGMWAWGLSQMRDLVESVPGLDPDRVAVMGHSRLGKAAPWAGVQDLRFAMVVSNNSGCGGAALSRRAYGETVGRITRAFPHWFCRRFSSYAEREAALPIDQHQLLALVAPRALYVASAVEDRWADPKGEFLAAAELDPLYGLFGMKGLGTRTMPAVDKPIGDAVRYHVRTGGHDVTMYDWQQYLRAAADLLTAR